MSYESYEELIPHSANTEDGFQGCDITTLVVLLEYLDERLDKVNSKYFWLQSIRSYVINFF